MRTVIYSRVSTDRQETSNQTSELLKKYPDAEVIEEIGSGAKTRPQLDLLLSSLVKGDMLVIAALDRLGRSTRDVLDKVDNLHKTGVILVSAREGFDLSTSVGQFMMTILAAVSQLERSMITDRVKAALKAKKEQGIKLGRPIKTGTISRATKYRRLKNATRDELQGDTVD